MYGLMSLFPAHGRCYWLQKLPKRSFFALTGVRSVFILIPVLGLTWVLGMFAVNKDTLIFHYFFAIFNSAQGLLIFLVQCVFDKKVRTRRCLTDQGHMVQDYRRSYRGHKRERRF
ncbi:hypothetical protein DPMN_124700 [Dreissena polymorpha]|uniref:Uncharacterized protein n=1 Tax=Dreissena polymorpha TaxID=45954 RepID=A0A9D4JST0_DREPO|nr:hypothetical protein DPMN_124700 [Dreissena polymorpha]